MVTVAVLPIKTFARAKHRLAEAVDVPDRRALAEAMVGDVLAGARRPSRARPGGRRDGRAARRGGGPRRRAPRSCTTPTRPASRPPPRSASTRRSPRGAERALLVPGDCPALDPGEVDGLLARQGRAGVVIVPDRHGSGTNALLLSPPDGDRALVRRRAPSPATRRARTRRGAVVRVAEVRSLGLDVDTPDDLAALRARARRAPGRGAAHARAAGADAAGRRGRRVIELEPLPGAARRSAPGDDLAGAARAPRGELRAGRRGRGRAQGRLQGRGARRPRSPTSSPASGRARWPPSTARTRAPWRSCSPRRPSSCARTPAG